MKNISVDQDIFNLLVSKSTGPSDAIASVLRRELKVPQPQVTFEVDEQTYDFIAARTSIIGESTSDILRRHLGLSGTSVPPPPTTPPTQPPDTPPITTVPVTVIFRIVNGTGSLAWNARDAAVAATVGDTLRIVNDDSIPHRLHTDGRPFSHPANDIPPNQTADFLLMTAFSPEIDGPLTDHDYGLQAQFWIRVAARV
jgi:hypothetical protein